MNKCETNSSRPAPEAATDSAITPKPVAWCRRDTVLTWEGQRFNAAMMFPSPDGLLDPIPLYVNLADAQRTDAVPAHLFDLTPQLVAQESGPEPSLREIMHTYYTLNGIPSAKAGQIVKSYIDALRASCPVDAGNQGGAS